MGEVWAAMLYDILWNMVDVAGITPAANIGKQNKGTAGNTALLKILVAGMKIQPCNPSVIQARDAIIVAENVLYKGKFKCAIWKGFAKRGLGINADEMFTNSMDIPEDCRPVNDGDSCSNLAETRCWDGVTSQCAYYNSFKLTWKVWYKGGC